MVAMAQPWEYQIKHLPIEHEASRGEWRAASHQELERLGEEGWDAVLVLKREPRYVDLLLKRPKAPKGGPATATTMAGRSIP